MLDVSVAYSRYKFLGKEFLTWLWFMMETDKSGLEFPEAEESELAVGDRIVLENMRGNRNETITIKGDRAGLEEGLVALKKGALVAEINLAVRSGEEEWRFSLKGESLNISSLKPPERKAGEAEPDTEQQVLGRIEHVERASDLVNCLYRQFVRQRVCEDWTKKTVPAISGWIRKSS